MIESHKLKPPPPSWLRHWLIYVERGEIGYPLDLLHRCDTNSVRYAIIQTVGLISLDDITLNYDTKSADAVCFSKNWISTSMFVLTSDTNSVDTS